MKQIDESWYKKPTGIAQHESAGGIVARKEAGRIYIALVHERSYVDCVLPKGHIEPGETPQQTATREIAEEAGFEKLTFLASLGKKERLAFDKKSWKITHYFLFQTDEVNVTPLDTEHHTLTEWFLLDDLPNMFWPEQKKLILENRDKINELLK